MESICLLIVCIVFVALIQLVASDICERVDVSDIEYIKSPNYPEPYPPYERICWDIYSTSPDRPRLLLIEEDFYVKTDNPGCFDDYLEVHDDGEFKGRYCGESAFGELVSEEDKVTLTFKTDGPVVPPAGASQQSFGFSIRIESTDRKENSGWSTFGIVVFIGSLVALTVVSTSIVVVIYAVNRHKRRGRTNNAPAQTTVNQVASSSVGYNVHGQGVTINTMPTSNAVDLPPAYETIDAPSAPSVHYDS